MRVQEPRLRVESVRSLYLRLLVNGAELGRATGFVLVGAHGPRLITSLHVLTGRDFYRGNPLSKTAGIPTEVEITFTDARYGIGNGIQKVQPLYDANGDPHWFEHPQVGPKWDMAALPLTELEHVQLLPWDLAEIPDGLLDPGDIVSVVGFPFGYTGYGYAAIWSTGFLATDPEIDVWGFPLMLIDCRSRIGQSGSPVLVKVSDRPGLAVPSPGVQDDTRLIGLYSGRRREDSDLGYVWKSSTLAQLTDSKYPGWSWEKPFENRPPDWGRL